MDEITYIPLPPDAPPFTLPMLDLSGVRRKFLDVNYAGTDNPAQTMDILLPGEGDGPFPVLIQFHGGAFLGGDKRDAQNIYLAKGIQRGYAVVNVNGDPTVAYDKVRAIIAAEQQRTTRYFPVVE